MIKKTSRTIGTLFLIIIAGYMVILSVSMAIRQYALRPITGQLTAVAPSAQFKMGDFQAEWDGQRLVITQQTNPDKVLWATVPDTPFIAAAQGIEAVEEARGSFFFQDDLQTICPDQRITSLEQQADTLRIRGTLACGRNWGDVPYEFSLHQTQPNHLAFNLLINDPLLNRTYLTYASDAEEHFFGFGEQFSFFDFKGKRLPIFVSEQGVGRGAQPITAGADIQARSGGKWYTSYAAVPHYITSQLRSLFLENYEYMVFDLRQDDQVQLQVWSNEINGRLLSGNSPSSLISSYTEFSGRMRPLPDWVLDGAIVGMQGGTEKVRQVWADLQANETPIAAFWLQDWEGQRTTSFGKQLWWNWELDESRYPGWDKLVADLAANGTRVMVYINPFLADVTEKENAQRNLFQEAQTAGYLIQTSEGDPYLIQNTSFSAGLVDLTNPSAVNWMKAVIEDELIGSGVSGWMADFGEALPYDAVLYSGESAANVHNRYPEDWAKLNREVVEATPGGEDILFFSRSGFTRSPGDTTLFWLGDQMVSWDEHDGIKTAVTGLLSSGLSGYAFNHSDIGGYTTITSPIANYHRSQELLLRWMDLNAFTAVFRSHEGNIPDVNHQVYSDAATMAHFSRMARVYQAWGFYRKALVQEAAETGLPVVRHPFIHYPDDATFYEMSYQQFMVGDQFMIAPVLDPDIHEVTVYLPEGRWVHLWTGDMYDKGWATIAAPLGETAVFYRQGSAEGLQFHANLAAAGLIE